MKADPDRFACPFEKGSRDARIEAEVEAVEATRFAEVGALEAPGGVASFAHGELVLEEQFEELVVAKPVGGGFQQACFKRFGEAAILIDLPVPSKRAEP